MTGTVGAAAGAPTVNLAGRNPAQSIFPKENTDPMTKNNAAQGPEQFESILDAFLGKLSEAIEALGTDESTEENEDVKGDEFRVVFQSLFESFYGGEFADESEESEESTKGPETWNVIVYNDDVTTFGEATEALVEALGMEIRRAVDLVALIDREGAVPLGIAGTYAEALGVFEALRKAGLKVGLERA